MGQKFIMAFIFVGSMMYLMYTNTSIRRSLSQNTMGQTGVSESPDFKNKKNETTNKNPIIAKIGDLEITEEDVVSQDSLILYSIQQQEYEFKMGRIRRIITEQYLNQKSLESKLNPQEYVKKYIVKGKNIEPNESEIMDFARDQGVEDYSQLKANPDVLKQMKQFLSMKKEFDLVQDEITKWMKTQKVSYHLKRPSLPMEIPEYTSPAWGPREAPVKIFMFSDFECPYCAKAGQTILKIKEKYGDKIRLVYKHFPLAIHKNAMIAAQASVCIEQNKVLGFWQYFKVMLNKHDNLSASSIRNDSIKIIEAKKYDECLNLPSTEATVLQDVQLGEKIGLESTPVFFVNGEMIKGNVPYDIFVNTIEEHLKQ